MARERSKNREDTQGLEARRRGGNPMSGLESRLAPFGLLHRWFDDMDRMFEDFGFPTFQQLPRTSSEAIPFSPHVDIFERNGDLVISADLPGLSKEDVKVDITKDAVLIEGERKYENEVREEGIYRSERGYGHFRRQILLPEGVNPDTAAAKFKNGVLEITLDGTPLVKARRRLDIQTEEGQKAA